MPIRFIFIIAGLASVGFVCVGCGSGEKAAIRACEDFIATTSTLPLLNGTISNLKLKSLRIERHNLESTWKSGKKYRRRATVEFSAKVGGHPAQIHFGVMSHLTNSFVIDEIMLDDPNPLAEADLVTSAAQAIKTGSTPFLQKLGAYDLQHKEIKAQVDYNHPAGRSHRHGTLVFEARDRATTATGQVSIKFTQWKFPNKSGIFFASPRDYPETVDESSEKMPVD